MGKATFRFLRRKRAGLADEGRRAGAPCPPPACLTLRVTAPRAAHAARVDGLLIGLWAGPAWHAAEAVGRLLGQGRGKKEAPLVMGTGARGPYAATYRPIRPIPYDTFLLPRRSLLLVQAAAALHAVAA